MIAWLSVALLCTGLSELSTGGSKGWSETLPTKKTGANWSLQGLSETYCELCGAGSNTALLTLIFHCTCLFPCTKYDIS